MDSIKNVTDTELNENSEKLLNNMKKLRHTANDVIGSIPLKELKQGCYNLIINVGDDEYPVYYNATTVFAGGSPEITDDIHDEENYLGVTDDDEMMWFALALQLAHQTELLQNENNQYNEDLVKANEEIDNLQCKLAEEIKARQEYEESLTQLREDLTAADNEIEGLEESLREANKKCTEYVNDIDKLEVDNKRLSARIKSLVIDKTNRPDIAEKVSDPKEDIETDLDMGTLQLIIKIIELENENESLKKELFGGVPTKFGEQERGTPEDKIVKMDMETGLMMQQIAQLNTRIAQLEENLRSTETKLTTANSANDILRNQIAVLKDDKKEAELLAYRLTRGDMHVQFDNMKSLEHENGVLKNENAELNQKLYQKEDEDDLRKRIAEYAQKNEDLLGYNKRLRQEITKLRVNAGLSVADSVDGIQQISSILEPHIVNANDDMKYIITYKALNEVTSKIKELESENDSLRQEISKLRVQFNSYAGATVVDKEDMQQTITKETFAELTAKINELETKLKDKDERINQLSKNNAALSVENRNFGDLLKEADGNARFYAREVDHLREENDKIYSILNDAVKVVRERNKKQSEVDI